MIRRTIDTDAFSINHPHPILKRIYYARGIKTDKELEHGLEHLLPYQSLLGINDAVTCLYDALKHEKKILIVGDFDADGATSTAVAIRALRSFGAKQVDFLVPNRFSFGYGLTQELVAVAHEQFAPALIVTVDNGIANHAGVLAAKQLGMQVVITDHHLAAETLPLADAIVNPNQPHDPFPSKHIAGVGVIFYVMLALRRHLSDCGWFEE
ncbi:MAG: DHH family phosphoesterase, partial [Gammaproteobacteria bacterium]|nr:DHH family phosphoesterase [Gammaproteobacteria bacterium]